MNIAALTQIQAAALLSVAPRTLRDWHDAPRNADGSYPGPALVAYYVAKLGGSAGEFDDQRERLNAAQAEKVEMENAVRRGQLADVREVERAWADFVSNARAKALAMPAKLSPRLVNLGDAGLISAAIRADVYALLAELVEYRPVDGGPVRSDAPAVASVDAAADADRERVGGPRAAAQQRKQRRARAVAD